MATSFAFLIFIGVVLMPVVVCFWILQGVYQDLLRFRVPGYH
jgi:hypothetical protein